jgi:hypothetical protein
VETPLRRRSGEAASRVQTRCGSPGGADLPPCLREREGGRKKKSCVVVNGLLGVTSEW